MSDEAANSNLPTVQLPLAAPQRPVLFNMTVMRIAHVPLDGAEAIEALQFDAPGEVLAGLAAKLKPGHVEIAFTDGFGQTRTLIVSPAELCLLLTQAERFIQELPR